MTAQEQAHFRILKIVSENPQITQRDLAVQLGISVGKANYLVKALIEKGQIKIGNFKQAENKLKYAYLLTPQGIRERIRLTRDYLVRVEAEYVALKTEVELLNQGKATFGYLVEDGSVRDGEFNEQKPAVGFQRVPGK